MKDLEKNPLLIGKIHNEEMENVYKKLLTMKQNGIAPNLGIDDFVEKEIIENLRRKINFGNIYNLQDYNFIKNELPSTTNKRSLSNIQIEQVSNFEQELFDLVDQNLTKAQFNISANNILNDYLVNTSDNLQQTNLQIIYSVTINSYTYWTDNYIIWSELFPNEGAFSTRISDAGKGRVVKADIGGAVRGAITGAIGGAFAGGIGALPGALVGACISSSVGSAATGIREYCGYSSWW